MRRISLLVWMIIAMIALMGLTAAPALAADSPPAVGEQSSSGVCGDKGNSVGVITPPGAPTPGSVDVPAGAGCSSGCSSTKGQR
jgi:hypothetical protein